MPRQARVVPFEAADGLCAHERERLSAGRSPLGHPGPYRNLFDDGGHGCILTDFGGQPLVPGSAWYAAAMRFAFQRGGPVWTRGDDPAVYRLPALPLLDVLRDQRILIFLIVWFGLNFLFSFGSLSLPGAEQSVVAWQAHIGGFVAGLLMFGWFDPVSHPTREDPAPSTDM